MEYRLRTNKNDILSYPVESGERGSFRLVRDDGVVEVDYTTISPYHLHLVIDGVGVNAYICPDGQGQTVLINGISYYLEDADRRPVVKKAARTAPTQVTAPMPAVVVSVLVSEGTRVAKGDGLVVVSAMKMETTLTAPYNGLVTAVNTSEGEKVMPGIILVDIEKE
jgi:3-methylcrotonyl-CoA carboxylase alpha subunit